MSKNSVFKLSAFFLIFQTTQAQSSEFLYLNWMDTQIPPSKDFFSYANANWVKSNPIPKDYGRWSIFEKLDKKVSLQIKDMIATLPKQKEFNQRINQQIYEFYQTGLDTKTIEEVNSKPLQPIIQKILAYQNLKQLSVLLADLHALGIDAFYGVTSTPDMHRPKQNIGVIVQSGLNLPHRDYYLKETKEAKKLQEKYRAFLKTIFLEQKYTESQANQAVNDTFEIEKKLAELFKPEDYFRNPQNIDNQIPSNELTKKYQNLYLNEYFSERKLTNNFTINNYTPDYLESLNLYLAQLNDKKIKNYLIAQVIFVYAQNLNLAFSKPYCQLSMEISGSLSCPTRWETVVKELNHFLGFAVGDLYVARYSRDGEIQKTNTIINNVKQQMRIHLMDSTWLSSDTKRQALIKLEHMQSRVGFNHFEIDYKPLNIKKQSYVQNALALSQFETQRMLNKIGKAIDDNEWDMSPQSINAYYDIAQNRINIPLGILQAPFFDINASNAINYGGIGTVIGHELSHGFDDMGAQFNEKGQFHQWWTKKDWATYQEKVSCIVQQFSSYPVQGTKHRHLNGKLVSGEAIADLMGVNLAFNAYKQSNEAKEDIAIGAFSPEQQYFIGYGHIWASKVRNEEALKRALTDPHPPMNLRVNGTLRNIPGFYKAFNLSQDNIDNMCHFF
jgi:putative endopeptidase